ncbi:MAG: FtsQ-type POTRA domain-containing protein [Bacteroidetes bacterium]|nr:FtsQ-type POTRA domain-containing protein [Bacteroidota bacterium]
MSKPIKKRLILLGGVLAAGLLLLMVAWFWKNRLPLTDFVVEGNQEVSTRQIIEQTGLKKGVRLSSVNLLAVQTRLKRLPWVESATAVVEFPTAVRITITERTPVARVFGAWEGYIDRYGHGMPLSATRVFDLPLLGEIRKSDFDGKYGKTLNADIRILAKTLDRSRRQLPALYHELSDFRLTGTHGTLVLYTTHAQVPVYVVTKNLGDQLVSLRAFWKQVVSVTGPDAFQYIDLRNHGVITTKERG